MRSSRRLPYRNSPCGSVCRMPIGEAAASERNRLSDVLSSAVRLRDEIERALPTARQHPDQQEGQHRQQQTDDQRERPAASA